MIRSPAIGLLVADFFLSLFLLQRAAAGGGPGLSALPLSTDTLFPGGSYILRTTNEIEPHLAKIRANLATNRKRLVAVFCHSDQRPFRSEMDNFGLSGARAGVLAAHLGRNGVDSARILAIGLGSGHPVRNVPLKAGDRVHSVNRRCVLAVVDGAAASILLNLGVHGGEVAP